MRILSKSSLVGHLEAAGFVEIEERADEHAGHGVVWACPWSLPFTARRPDSDTVRT